MDSAQKGVISNALIGKVKDQFLLNWQGNHGIKHWARVYDIGMHLAETYDVNQQVIQLFALFHDACRENEKNDPGHGKRGADLALKLKGQYFDLLDDDFQLLQIACRNHTHADTHNDVTVQVCFDADRLDLGRVKITPDPKYLCTEAAKTNDMIDWALQNSKEGHIPDNILGIY
ncbi:MAG: HD domain-containing protein [Deltaproteobacteria bacterium]|nr:HD domain-containing protein [Deltaproteobacteria bacterium]MBT4527979.1 HD domain-containing protein [Deltaproteobacteria bacterium]